MKANLKVKILKTPQGMCTESFYENIGKIGIIYYNTYINEYSDWFGVKDSITGKHLAYYTKDDVEFLGNEKIIKVLYD